MKVRINAALLLLLSLCASPMHAMKRKRDQVTSEQREAVDRFVARFDISQAILFSDHVRVERLLAKGADPNDISLGTPDTDPNTCGMAYSVMDYACHNSYTEAYKALTGYLAARDQNAEPNPLLHQAARSGKDEIVEVLLRYGANPECDYESQSALYRASLGHYKVMGLLLRYGANPNRLSYHPADPFVAEYPCPLDVTLDRVRLGNGYRYVAKLLLAHGAKAHGPEFKNLSHRELCARIWKAEDPDISEEKAHEKQRQFTLDHWNMKNPAQFILDRRMGLVKKPRCKCWEVEV